MLLQTLTKRLSKHKLALIALALLGAVLAMGGTLFMRLEYKTTSRFIIIQEQRFADAFTQAKSAEYTSGILSRVVSTDSFREAVFTRFDYLSALFPEQRDEQRESWNKSIEVVPIKDTGILSISAYNIDRSAAEAIAFAVGDTLTNTIKTYLGNGAAIEIKPIDGPITTDYPARPSFVQNAVAGLLIGALLGVVLFGFREGKPRRERVPAPVLVMPAPIKPSKPKSMPAPRPVVRPAAKRLHTVAKPKDKQMSKQAEFSTQEFERWLKKAA